MSQSARTAVVPRQITLCGANGCCPTVNIDDTGKTIVIKDDFGGSVTLTFEQWSEALTNAKI